MGDPGIEVIQKHLNRVCIGDPALNYNIQVVMHARCDSQLCFHARWDAEKCWFTWLGKQLTECRPRQSRWLRQGKTSHQPTSVFLAQAFRQLIRTHRRKIYIQYWAAVWHRHRQSTSLPAPRAFLQTPAPVLERFLDGPMGSNVLSSAGLQFGTAIGRAHILPTFFCASFFPFFCPVHPALPQAIFFPQIPSSGTSDLLFLVEKTWPAGAGFWGRFWTGFPHRKKGKSFFLAREKRRAWVQSK